MRLEQGKRIIPLFLLFLSFSFLLLLLDDWGILRSVRAGAESLVIPVKTKIYSLQQQKNRKTGKQENGEIERKIAELEAQVAALKSENVSMRRLLGVPLSSDWRFAPARVIGASSREFLQIDKGRQDGLKEGMTVVFDNVLVGRIIRTGEHFSEVLLPFSSGAKILAVSRSSEGTVNAKGLLLGQGARLSFERVTLKETLTNGDLLVTAGDEFFPPNLLLGKLGKIYKKEGEIFQKAEVEPFLIPEELETVFVVIDR